ncbi:MAG: DUF4004 family protein [Sporolactobacillus sp.]
MEEELIAKKDLLEQMQISYGQLYRWKRKQLIPESWFIRKATFTGQETFFPKKKILERIQAISEMKDTLSLDQLAERFSPQSVAKISLTQTELIERNIVSKPSVDLFNQLAERSGEYHFNELLALKLIDEWLVGGSMNRSEVGDLLTVLQENTHQLYDKNSQLYFIRKTGVPMFLITEDDGALYFDSGVKVIEKLAISSKVSQLKRLIEQETIE